MKSDTVSSKGNFSSSNIKSPSNTPADQEKTLGGMPPKKSVDQIDKTNTPSGRSRAPGAVGF